MGCDIHAFLEYKKPNSEWWNCFAMRELRLDRHYGVFAKLANVRNRGDEIKPISLPRGLPPKYSSTLTSEYWLFITESGSDCDGCASPEDAARWVANGSSKYQDDKVSRVSDPDAHSLSWITTDELEQVINDPLIQVGLTEYRALYGAMRALETDGNQVRLVFWFDN